MAMSRADLLDLFHKTANEIVEKELPKIVESTAISELGIDSLGMLEIIGSMERHLKITLPDEALSGVQTVKDLVDLVQKRQVGAGA
jgi:acyl carrier protein